MRDYFEIFHLPRCFRVDVILLQEMYYKMQSKIHPDKFVRATQAEKKVAMELTVQINQAYEVLKNPVKRAIYLCECQGINIKTDCGVMLPSNFLEQQINWREMLNSVKISKNINILEQLKNVLSSARTNMLNQIESLFKKNDLAQVLQFIYQLMFLEKLDHEISIIYTMLEQ